MAQATTIKFSKFRVLLGDGASPEVFTAPCGFNSRSLKRTKGTNEIDIPDCSDEDAPAWVGREVKSLDWSVSGEGVLAAEAVAAWEDFFDSIDSRHVQIEIEFPAPVGTITMNGSAHLTNYEVNGERGGKVQLSIELVGDGALVTAP
jgi:predicted secreted protein